MPDKKPTIKPKQQITIHRDGTVSYFSVYLRQWRRTSAASLVDKHDDFSALTTDDRAIINDALRSAAINA